jgi:hypothetical protein
MEDIDKIISKLEEENSKQMASDPLVKTSLSVVEEFLKKHPVLCYGGTAINNLLPPEDRFYNPEVDIPDYDFFSKTPQRHAMLIANQLAEKGIKSVEVRPGMHLGTFKVFADFQGVADITSLDETVFDRLWKEDIIKNDIHYVTPNYLRMSMYLELSRPRGDVSRWKKVYHRLQLLNKHYPIVCPGAEKEPDTLDKEHQEEVEKILKTQPVVLLGITASQLHAKKRKYAWYTPVTLLADAPVIEALVKDKKTKKYEGTEVLPAYTEVLDEKGKPMIRYHETSACHSYHRTSGEIRVASIPTILQFFFAYMYSGISEAEVSQITCVAQRLVDLVNEKPKRRFSLLTPIDCIGKQETLVDMRKHKSILYEQLSKNKSSPEFLKYFFTYNPNANATQRAKLQQRLRKTQRAGRSSR